MVKYTRRKFLQLTSAIGAAALAGVTYDQSWNPANAPGGYILADLHNHPRRKDFKIAEHLFCLLRGRCIGFAAKTDADGRVLPHILTYEDALKMMKNGARKGGYEIYENKHFPVSAVIVYPEGDIGCMVRAQELTKTYSYNGIPFHHMLVIGLEGKYIRDVPTGHREWEEKTREFSEKGFLYFPHPATPLPPTFGSFKNTRKWIRYMGENYGYFLEASEEILSRFEGFVETYNARVGRMENIARLGIGAFGLNGKAGIIYERFLPVLSNAAFANESAKNLLRRNDSGHRPVSGSDGKGKCGIAVTGNCVRIGGGWSDDPSNIPFHILTSMKSGDYEPAPKAKTPFLTFLADETDI